MKKKEIAIINKNKNEKKFRISSKKLFLIYPQCDVKLETFLIQLKSKLANSSPCYI